MVFIVVISLVIIQRLVEIFIARRNEKWMFTQGAYEVGASHYPYMLALHSSFFLFLIAEVIFDHTGLSPFFPILLGFFLFVQGLRIWCLRSLGRFWNTKIIILPHAQVVKKGPYLYMRHPNYTIVSLEFILLPFMFEAYLTAFLFTLLNMAMLSVRIPLEERALREATNYSELFDKK